MYNTALDMVRPKVRMAVRLRLLDGEVMDGNFFASPGQRAIDLMNGDKPYVAFESGDGEIEILNKSAIARVKPTD